MTTTPQPKVTLYIQDQILEDIKACLSADPDFAGLLKPAQLNKIIHFISNLYLKPITDKRYRDRFHYIYISSKFLVQMYTWKTYKHILPALLKYGIIEKSEENYKVGSRTKSYRLSPNYLGYKFTAIDCHEKLARKQIEYRKLNHKSYIVGGENPSSSQVYDKLERAVQKITVEFPAAQAFILNQLAWALQNPDSIEVKPHQYSRQCQYCPKKELSADEAQLLYAGLMEEAQSVVGDKTPIPQPMQLKQLQTVLNRYHADLISITRIHNKDFSFHVDAVAGRIHTNLTNLSGDLRQFIRLNGERIVGRDLVSSQPVFLACLLLNEYRDAELPDDVFRYINICLAGGKEGRDIYRHIMQKHGLTDRKKFKSQFYEKVLFSRVPHKLSKIASAFKTEFPTVWTFICEQKKDDHAQLAINLQKLESHMFVGIAAEAMQQGIDVLTLHDARYVEPAHAERVDQLIIARFRQEYGVRPTISC